MTRNLRHDLKRVVAGVCALMLVSGTVPVKPIAEVINTAIMASAEGSESTNVYDFTFDEYTGSAEAVDLKTISTADEDDVKNWLIDNGSAISESNPNYEGYYVFFFYEMYDEDPVLCRLVVESSDIGNAETLDTMFNASSDYTAYMYETEDEALHDIRNMCKDSFHKVYFAAAAQNTPTEQGDFTNPIKTGTDEAYTLTYFEDFSDNELPNGWSAEGNRNPFSFTNGCANTTENTGGYGQFATPKLDLSGASSAVLTFKIKKESPDDLHVGIYMGSSGSVYDDDAKIISENLINKTDWVEKSITIPSSQLKANKHIIFFSNSYGNVYFDDIKLVVTYQEHTHSFTYSAGTGEDANKITATCNGTGVGDCDITDGLTLTINAPTGDLTYDGTAKEATLSTVVLGEVFSGYNSTVFPGTLTIEYYKGETKLDGAPVNAGDYTAKVTVGGATASVDYTIAKAPFTVTAAENLTYTGEAQNLVKGNVPEGTKFSFEAPIAFDVDAELEKVEELQDVLYTCKKSASGYEESSFYSAADMALSDYHYAISTFAHNGNVPIEVIEHANIPISDMDELAGMGTFVPANEAEEALEYIETYVRGLTAEKIEERCKPVEPDWLDTDTAEATDAGTYTVYYKGTGNYDDTIKSFTVTIAKADFTVQPADDLVYTGEALNLVKGEVPAGTKFSLEAPIVFDVDAELKKIDGLRKTLEGCDYSSTGEEANFYYQARMALADYQYAVAYFASSGNHFFEGIDSANRNISDMDYLEGHGDFDPADEAEEALEYIETYVRDVTAEKIEERCKTVEPDWLDTDTAEATKAGDYTVYYKGSGNYDDTIKNFTVTIAKADPTVTAPTAKTDLVYNGKDQALIEGGSTTGGTIQYSLDGEEFSTKIPEATNAGDYTVYYKVIGDDNYNSTDVKPVDVTIAKADLPVTVTGYEGTFDGDPHGISVDVGDSDAVVYYAQSALTADNYADIGSTESPSFTDAGTYKVYYYVTTGNYDPKPVRGFKLVNIKKADAPALTDDQKPTPVDKLVYTGEALDLVTAPENIPDGYSIRYSINGGAWISALPTAIESGTYTVAYKYVENMNYKDIAGETFTITVKDKYTEPMWVWADDYSSATATFIKNNNSSEPIILDAEVTSEVVSEPTYTEYGKTVYIATVKLEGKTYTYRKPVITAKLSLTHVEAVPATCDEAGNIEYWFDAENEKYFADDKGENEITEADTIVAPIDHVYGEPQWIWNAENAATATFKCANCGDEQTINAVVTAEVTAPTYTKNGKTVYTATVNFDGKTYTDTLTVTIGKKAYTAPTISYLKGDGAVKLSWNAIEGAERYAIAGFIDGKWKLLNRTEDTSFIIENLEAGKEYKVAVVAMFDGEYIMDFSNAIVVTLKPAQEVVYPKITEIEYNEQYHQFKLNWTEVPNAQNYGIAVYLAGKWKIQTQTIPATTTSFTSPKLKAGQTYKMIVCAKVNGKWDLSALNSRAFTVTVK